MKKYFKFIFCIFVFGICVFSFRVDTKANTLDFTITGKYNDNYEAETSVSYSYSSNNDAYLICVDKGSSENWYVVAYNSLSNYESHFRDPYYSYLCSTKLNIAWSSGMRFSMYDCTADIPFYRIETDLPDVSYIGSQVSALISGDSSDWQVFKSEGSLDNPKFDENIGTLILDKTIMYEESNGNDINDLYNLWSWKNKTSTGFSLSDNDYAQTFIQVKVESKCVIYSDLRHTKVKQNFDNYGEKGMLFNQISVNNQPLKVSYLTDVPEVLPLTHAESHNPLYVGYNYTLYFRVVCTNSTQVIPDNSSSSEWHCGGWRAMDCNADVLNNQSDKSSNGHFDDDGNWIEDEDDGNNDVTAGSDSVHDTDDAKDSFANYQPSSGMSTDTAIGNLKDLMNMVGYIPTMIATLFSFLPSWCTTLIGVTFASMLVLIVYKLIRG